MAIRNREEMMHKLYEEAEAFNQLALWLFEMKDNTYIQISNDVENSLAESQNSLDQLWSAIEFAYLNK